MNTVISRTAARVITPLATLLALWLLLRSHSALGGGFLAATALGLAAVFRIVTIGGRTTEAVIDRGATTLIGTGLLAMIGYALAGLLWGDGLLRATTVRLELPSMGSLSLSSALLFEFGIAATVFSVTVAVLDELWSGPR